MVAVLAAPLVVFVSVVIALAGRRASARCWWWLAGAGMVAVVLVVLTGGWGAYWSPYQEAWYALIDAVGEELLLRTGPEAALVAGFARLPGWLLAQLPLAVAAGTVTAACCRSWRARFNAPWRVDPAQVLPEAELRGLVAALDEEDVREPVGDVDQLVLRLGVDAQSSEPYDLPAVALRQHTIIAGATGYGKTKTVLRLLYELVVTDHAKPLRVPVVLLDMKADPELVTELGTMAERAGQRFRVVTVTGTGATYNPIKHGSVEQVCSRIVETLDQVAGGGFSEPHHREAAEVYLRHAMAALDDLVDQAVVEPDPRTGRKRRWRRDLPDLARLMSLRQLAERTSLLSATTGRTVHSYLEYLQSDGRSLLPSIPGLAARITNLVAGDAGRVLTDAGHRDAVDVYGAITGGDIVLFSLSAAADARAARQIGSLLLTDVGAVGDRLLAEGWGRAGGFFLCGVDEFSALSGSTMTSLFARVRAAGGGLLLATQDLADLDAVSPQFRAAVLTNTNTLILHRQRSSAEQLAAHVGTRPGWEETLTLQDDDSPLGTVTASTGAAQLRPVDELLVHPQILRSLPRGQAIITVGHPSETSRVVQIAPAPVAVCPPVGHQSAVEEVHCGVPLAKTPRQPAAPISEAPQRPPTPPVPGADMWS
ncbi:type IV secretory system conjugative DNA transfer family protein [Streptomyces sodiiphilus]|uniref:type IV secretory system conjugative DNA transfer family protein n=1 Tax=Streptomyces sodiiphilus TaxID=226217 RepID=UPI0031D4D019